jgi:hypothetical protein
MVVGEVFKLFLSNGSVLFTIKYLKHKVFGNHPFIYSSFWLWNNGHLSCVLLFVLEFAIWWDRSTMMYQKIFEMRFIVSQGNIHWGVSSIINQ